MADLIPNEIWYHHIFPKLPPKSVLLCKCVCRAWNCVLSDPEFVRIHLLHQHQQIIVNFIEKAEYYSVDTRTTDAVLKLNHKILSAKKHIIGSSNGLLCFRLIKNSKDYLAISNPSTGDFMFIPRLTKHPFNFYYHNLSCFGFCYDLSINDVKIVYFGRQPRPRQGLRVPKSRVDIYSIKSNSWKTVKNSDAPFSLNGVVPLNQGRDVNGSIYWLVNNVNWRPRLNVIVFNVKDDKFRKLQLPCGWDSEDAKSKDLTVLGSSIGLYRFSVDNQRLVVWTLKEGDTDEWTKLMDKNVFFSRSKEVVADLKPICLARNHKVLLLYHDLQKRYRYKTKFALYDPITNEIENCLISGISNELQPPMEIVAYVESLVSLKSISRADRFTVDSNPNKSNRKHKRLRLV